MILGLSGCSWFPQPGTVGYVSGFGGAVVADEPRAAMVARDVLSAGGNAADAAVSLYFSLAVTLPSTAGLGGGGSCVVRDAAGGVEAIDFSSRPGVHAGVLGATLPANPLGLFALHQRHGSFQWASLLAQAETLARQGVPVSRSLAADLNRAQGQLDSDPEAKRVYFHSNGAVLTEGDILTNYELAGVLSLLGRAPGEFYEGRFARDFASQATLLGAAFTRDDLRDLRAGFSDGQWVQVGADLIVLPAGSTEAKAAAELLKALPGPERRTVLNTRLSSSDPGRLPVPGTVFAVLDARGGAVACAVSSNGLFGTGRLVPGTGIFLAGAAPTRPAAVPILVTDATFTETHFAGGAGGGANAPAAAVFAALSVSDPAGELRLTETTATGSVAGAKVNAIACQPGRPSAGRCAAAVAPTGSGYSLLIGAE